MLYFILRRNVANVTFKLYTVKPKERLSFKYEKTWMSLQPSYNSIIVLILYLLKSSIFNVALLLCALIVLKITARLYHLFDYDILISTYSYWLNKGCSCNITYKFVKSRKVF